jgi:hypothetical protein
MATVIYNEDADDNIAEAEPETNVPFPLDLTDRSLSLSSGSADAEEEAEAAATTTPPTNNGGFNKSRVAKAGIALLALIAVVFAIIYGTNGTADDGGPSNIAPLPESSTSTNKAIDIEPKVKPPPPKGDVKQPPPPKIAELKTLAPTKAKVTKAPIPPKPAPITTPYPTDQGTSTVSTETTGPPTVADRNETRYF